MEKDWLTNKEASHLAVRVLEAREQLRKTGEQDLLKVLYTLAVDAYRHGQSNPKEKA